MSNWITDYVGQLEACLEAKFGRPCMWGRQPGAEASLDGCGCEGGACGQWYINVTAIYPFTAFGEPEPTGRCGAYLGADLVVGVMRCIPIDEDGGVEQSDLRDAFDQQMQDSLDLFSLILCCSPGTRFEVSVGGWTPIGPEGGCVGGQWIMSVAEK